MAAAVKRAQAEAGIEEAGDVHYVQVKGPLLIPALIADADKRGKPLVTRDANGSKPYARGATALGVAVALGEVGGAQIDDAVIARRMDLFSSVASTSAGGELKNCEVLLFGNSAAATSDFTIRHGVLHDVVDAEAIRALLGDTVAVAGQSSTEVVAAVFAKADASPNGLFAAGVPRCCQTRTSITSATRAQRWGRSLRRFSENRHFRLGGTEHQCAPGEMPIAAIVRV